MDWNNNSDGRKTWETLHGITPSDAARILFDGWSAESSPKLPQSFIFSYAINRYIRVNFHELRSSLGTAPDAYLNMYLERNLSTGQIIYVRVG
jgi:hypothetical protein